MPTIVWIHMPVDMLYDAAITMLQQRGETVFPPQIKLWHEGRLMDPATKRLSDHQIMVQDIVVVEVPEVPHSSFHGHRGDHHRDNQPHSRHQPQHVGNSSSSPAVKTFYAVRRGRNPGVYHSWGACERQVTGFSGAEHRDFKTEIEAYKYLVIPGQRLDTTPQPDLRQTQYRDPGGGFDAPKSQDKIKQTFKCPRFSGHSKDWKLWDKGFQRYLSIWDLDYVLQPDFFDDVPLPAQKLNDNKLVYFIL